MFPCKILNLAVYCETYDYGGPSLCVCVCVGIVSNLHGAAFIIFSEVQMHDYAIKQKNNKNKTEIRWRIVYVFFSFPQPLDGDVLCVTFHFSFAGKYIYSRETN